jgi:hypothetical protein
MSPYNVLNHSYIKDATHPHERTGHVPFHLANVSASGANGETFRLHVPREDTADIHRLVQIIGERPVALGGYSDIWKGNLMSEAGAACEPVNAPTSRWW